MSRDTLGSPDPLLWLSEGDPKLQGSTGLHREIGALAAVGVMTALSFA